MSNCCALDFHELALRHDLVLQRGDLRLAMGDARQQQSGAPWPGDRGAADRPAVLGGQGGIDLAEGGEIGRAAR